jgi:tetratricopeptide (TPR) repeat protein
MRTIPHALLILTGVLTAALANPGAVAQPTPAAKATAQDSDAAKKNALRAQAFKAKQNREFSKAGDLFLKLQKLDPTDPEPYLLAGECLEKSKRYNDALDVLEAGRKRFPAELRFSVGIARSYNLKGHEVLNTSGKFDNFVLFTLQDCVREAEGVLQKHPDNRDMRLILAQTLYTLRELDKCKTNSEELVKRFPDHRAFPTTRAATSCSGIWPTRSTWGSCRLRGSRAPTPPRRPCRRSPPPVTLPRSGTRRHSHWTGIASSPTGSSATCMPGTATGWAPSPSTPMR